MLHSHESFSQEKTRSLHLILLVTTDVQVGSFLQQVIDRETRHRVLLAFHEQQALRVVEEVKPDLFLLDYELVEKSGFALYEQLHTARRCADIPAFLSPLRKRFARYVNLPSLEARELSSELERFLSTLEELLV
ncbi:hypothetical protein [Reticulibacter mediterranei]|nr:hypothetical protein [Reticulibacter mediterranei]